MANRTSHHQKTFQLCILVVTPFYVGNGILISWSLQLETDNNAEECELIVEYLGWNFVSQCAFSKAEGMYLIRVSFSAQ